MKSKEVSKVGVLSELADGHPPRLILPATPGTRGPKAVDLVIQVARVWGGPPTIHPRPKKVKTPLLSPREVRRRNNHDPAVIKALVAGDDQNP